MTIENAAVRSVWSTPSLRRRLAIAAGLAVAALALPACGGVSASTKTPHWPHAEDVSTTPLPDGVSWQGVYFISTPGTRGMLHLLGDGEHIHGCWLAEDKHSRARFGGKTKDNVAMLDWTETIIGMAAPPTRLTAYLVLKPDADGSGKDKVSGEYGEDLSKDYGSKWEGVRQKGREPSEDACKVDSGDVVPSGDSPLD